MANWLWPNLKIKAAFFKSATSDAALVTKTYHTFTVDVCIEDQRVVATRIFLVGGDSIRFDLTLCEAEQIVAGYRRCIDELRQRRI